MIRAFPGRQRRARVILRAVLDSRSSPRKTPRSQIARKALKYDTPGAETMAPTPAKESDGAAAPVVGAVAAAVFAVVALL